MKLPVEEARTLCEGVLGKAGLDSESTAIIADVLIEAELRGRKGHGLIRLSGLVTHAQRKRGEIAILAEAENRAHLDGGSEIGYLTAHRAMTTAIEKARETGTGLVAVRNTTHCGMLAYYVLMATREDLIGFMTCNCSPRVAPFGGAGAVFGTNPIAIAIPGPDEPIVVDMATSAATTGDLLVAMQDGISLDEGLAYSGLGKPTRDPQAAREGALAAFGGHKGSALALVAQILSGVLSGASPLPEPGTNYGYLMAAIDPGVFTDTETFKSGVGTVLAAVKNAKPLAEEIVFPGERSRRARQQALREGIEIEPKLLQEIQGLL